MVAASGTILLGIIIGLVASLIQSLGLTFQRKSHVLNQRLPENQQKVEYKRPLWIVGVVIFITSNVLGSFVQIASLPVVILAPLGAVSLLWNAFFACVILGNPFSPWLILGTLLIAGGAVLIALYGVVPEPTHSLGDLLMLFRRPTFVAYFSLLGIVVVICLAITHLTEFSLAKRIAKAQPNLSPPPSPSPDETLSGDNNVVMMGLSDVAAEATVGERTPLLDRKSIQTNSRTPSFQNFDPQFERSVNRTRIAIAIAYASFSGILSGMCLLFAKSGVELLLLTFRGDNQFWRWQAWMLVLGLVGFALLQLWYMHKALTLADPTLVCPSAFCLYNISSIVNGLVYFDQFSALSPLHLGLVALGIVILLAGVWVVSIRTGEEVVAVAWNREEEDNSDDGSDAGTEAQYLEIPQPSQDEEAAESLPPSPSIAWGSSSEPGFGTFQHTANGDSSARALSGSRTSRRMRSRSPETRGHRLQPSIASEAITSPSDGSYSRHRRPTIESPPHRQSQHGRRRSSAQQYASIVPNSPPLPSFHTMTSITSTGLQIGLGPSSPGFSIVPRERRRRASHVHQQLGSSGSNQRPSQSRDDSQDHRRRRTVSEGDMRHIMSGLDDPDDRDVFEDRTPGELEGQPGESSDVSNKDDRNDAKKRLGWRWLRRWRK